MIGSFELTAAERKMVLDADAAEFGIKSRARRRYSVARNRGKRDDILFLLVAVANIRRERRVKVVGVASVDSPRVCWSGELAFVRSFCSPPMPKIGWRELDLLADGSQPAGAQYGRMYWFDRDSWKSHWYERADDCHVAAFPEPINIWRVIADNPRFRYCALPMGEVAFSWLRRYAVAPEIENFAKMDISHLASVRFVKELRADKGLFAYLRANLAAVRAMRLKTDVIHYGYRRGISAVEACLRLSESRRIGAMKREFGGLAKVKGFDWHGLYRYLERTRISRYEYGRYADYCLLAEADLTDRHTAFPPHLERRLAEFDKMAVRLRKAKERRENRNRNRLLARLAMEYAKKVAAGMGSRFVAVFPKCAADFVREGRTMGNCIGGGNYTVRHAEGLCVCVFIREADAPEKPFVDVEIDESGRVCQCYGRNNSRASVEVRRFAERVARRIFKGKDNNDNNKRKVA